MTVQTVYFEYSNRPAAERVSNLPGRRMRQDSRLFVLSLLLFCLGLLAPASEVLALPPACVVPDNGSGTVTLPPAGCEYLSPSDVHEIINGLPPGTTIQLSTIHRDFICNRQPGAPGVCSFTPSPGCDIPGGTLGGQKECADSSLTMNLHGTGLLAGWNRTLNLPITFETHVGPRAPGAPVQSFATDMFRLAGQLPSGDPDFDLLRVTAGTGFGMPSPGHTTLTQLPGGSWNVDSFFDITYRIDFIGRPGGPIGGMSGSTTATIRMATGNTGCVPPNCDDGNPCTNDACDAATGTCTHSVVNCDDGQICTDDFCNTATGGCTHTPTNCDDANPCTTDSCIQALLANPCVVPDNGGGTVTLPPAGCAYLSPTDVHEIVAGLPPGTTIQLGTIHRDFICGGSAGTPPSVCDFVPSPDCDVPGGALGGRQECADSTLAISLHGTGVLAGWNRNLQLPIGFQTHVGPRTPGAPVQSFDTDMYQLAGQLPPGDPDFDLLRITAGTNFGMPSPGHTTLTQLPGGNWAVDSFFDITYRIDFIGSPGGPLAGLSGSTTATIRMQTGDGVGCVHTPKDCDDSNACTIDACDPTTGACTHAPTNCDDNNACTNDSCVQGFAANPCEVVPNGGTVTLPPAGCEYLSPADVHRITDGLPAGTRIELGAIHRDFICHEPGGGGVCSFAGVNCTQGSPQTGEQECAESTLALSLHGVGLPIPDRTINLPISFETHTAPRTPGAPVQSFATNMFRLQGQIMGDPDFDLLRITGGTDFGMPSPGHTTLTLQPNGKYKVDSFFDITYRIDYIGAPGGPLAGMSGSTTATIRMSTGTGVGCVHTPVNCDDSNACTDDSCDPASGCVHSPTNCDDSNPCTTDSCVQAFAANPCNATNTGGTVVLPPVGCSYLSPDEVHEILNGLNPPTANIQFAPIHREFICHRQGATLPPQACDPLVASVCRTGTPQSGVDDCSDSTLQLNLHGVGISIPDRQINLPITFQTHQGPRTPGQPVQSFATDMTKLFGQLTGDPDFDLLRITGGTANGLPSPGHTTLTLQPNGTFKVDSFFDITYRIDYIGAPGGHLAGMSGSTTATIRMSTGTGVGCIHTPNPPPGEAKNLKMTKSGGPNIIIDWDIAPSATGYDMVRGRISALPVGPGLGDEVCLANDIPVPQVSDPTIPTAGAGLWYLPRASNACGVGPYGFQGVNGAPGAPRNTTTCP